MECVYFYIYSYPIICDIYIYMHIILYVTYIYIIIYIYTREIIVHYPGDVYWCNCLYETLMHVSKSEIIELSCFLQLSSLIWWYQQVKGGLPRTNAIFQPSYRWWYNPTYTWEQPIMMIPSPHILQYRTRGLTNHGSP